MTKYILLFLVISIISCGNGNTNNTSTEPTTTQTTATPAEQTASATPAPVEQTTSTSTAPATQTAPANQQNPQTPASQSSSSVKAPLTGTYWILIELNGKNMEGKTAKEPYLLLDPSSAQMKCHSGCNLVMGEVKFAGPNQLRFAHLLSTTSECKTPDLDAEFYKGIESTTGYSHQGNILLLTKGGSTTIMKFMAKK